MIKKLLIYVWGLLLIASTASYAQSLDVTGKVTAQEDGSALPGVNVIVKGTTMGTTTDGDGVYKISIPNEGTATLVFSFIGIKTTEVEVGGRTVVDVSVVSDATQLGEVVVVGYGTQLKHDLTGNIAKVKGSDIQNLPVTSFEQALQGRAAGVYVSTQNSKLGQGINVRVRGASSITAGSEPLYVVDGMIINQSNLSGNRAATNPLADLNFNDVESFEVLKDASASAIYGARAANGVVLITTKRGKDGKTNFNVNMSYGSSNPTHHRKFLNAEQYLELIRESAINRDTRSGLDPVNNPDDYEVSRLKKVERNLNYLAGDTDWKKLENNTDWEKQAYQKAGVRNFDLTANGGNEKTKFFISGGYTDQDGILIGNKFQRYSGRVNLDHQATRKLSFGLNLNISNTLNNRLADDKQFSSPLQLVAQSPITPVRDKQGQLYDDAINPASFYYPATVERENAKFRTSVFRNIAGVNAHYKLTNSLTAIGEYDIDLTTQNENRYQNSLTEDGRGVGGFGSADWVRIFNQTSRIYLNWNKVIDQHAFDVTAGYDFQRITRNLTRTEGQGYPVNELENLQSAATPTSSKSSFKETVFISYYARANYKFKQRYLLSLSARSDGSSKFGPDKKYGFYPAASAGWIISQENFLNSSSAISFLKVRSSYGLTGNAGIDDYQHLGGYRAVNYDNTTGLSFDRLSNPNLGWETTAQFDIGLDFGLLSDRITGELDYYNKQTSKLLLKKQIPSTLGVSEQLANVGKLENKGIELVLNYAIVRNSAFSWNIGFNVARNKNKVKELDNNQNIIDPGNSRFLNVVKVGQPIGVFYGAEYAGVDPANGDALWYTNAETPGETTNNYDMANKIVLGNPTPSTIYGFNMSATYKGFNLSVLFQGVEGNKIFNAAGLFMSSNADYYDNQTIDQLKRWQNPGDITDVPQARFRTNGSQASSRYLSDGSYLRLKTVSLGYSLPLSLISKISLTSAKIYITGQNLLTFTKYKGWDPEVNTDYTSNTSFYLGNDFYSGPQAKTFIVGVKVGF